MQEALLLEPMYEVPYVDSSFLTHFDLRGFFGSSGVPTFVTFSLQLRSCGERSHLDIGREERVLLFGKHGQQKKERMCGLHES